MKCFVDDKGGSRRVLDETPTDTDGPARRFVERHGDGNRVYDFVGVEGGARVYRYTETEPVR